MDIVARLTGLAEQWLQALQRPDVWVQLIILAIALLLGTILSRRLQRPFNARLGSGPAHGIQAIGLRTIDRLLLPVSILLFLSIGRGLNVVVDGSTVLLDIAIPILVSLALIRSLVYLLRRIFGVSPALRTWEHFITIGIWCVVVLHILDWLGPVLEALDAMGVTLGDSRITVLSVIKLLLISGLLLTFAVWITKVIENRVKASVSLSPSMRVGVVKFSKVFLLSLALLMALNAVGIDLTALTVFGGALGVGLGFGLQRIASNFISGFILILDRSIKPGDVITIGNKFGWVEELRARYIVVRNRDGEETLIPNENLITSEVINWSYSDRNVRMKVPVAISYDDDPEEGMRLMMEVALATPRVLKDPEPSVRLIEFGDNGILLELRAWVSDPEAGLGGVKSDVNLAIWKSFKQAGITFPYPQRDLYIKSAPRDVDVES